MVNEETELRVLQCVDSCLIDSDITCSQMCQESIEDAHVALSILSRQQLIEWRSTSGEGTAPAPGAGQWVVTPAGRQRLLDSYTP